MKGKDHPKNLKITHSHIVSNLYEFLMRNEIFWTLEPIDFHCMDKNKHWEISQNVFFRTGLEWCEDFHLWVNYLFNKKKSQNRRKL